MGAFLRRARPEPGAKTRKREGFMLDDLPVVTTPRVFRGLSAKGLLVMEFVAGSRATDAAFFREHDISAAKVSLAVLEAFAERGGRAASRDVRVAATSPEPRRPLSRDVP
mmetsp:Transcript_2919/g.8673  ORF Transcript_2919/g.8673 Transcript_2919/m.8673 type:complete len:110 (+) Transcript_2919:914-1243(+)